MNHVHSPEPSPLIISTYNIVLGVAQDFLSRNTTVDGRYDDSANEDLYRAGITLGYGIDADTQRVLAATEVYAGPLAVAALKVIEGTELEGLGLPAEAIAYQIASIASFTGKVTLSS